MMRPRPVSSATSPLVQAPLPVQCRDCALRRRPIFRPLSDREQQALAEIRRGQILLLPGEPLMQQGQRDRSFYTLYEGWALRSHSLQNGSAQVMDVLLPGDTVGLSAAFSPRVRTTVHAVTRLLVCVLTADDFPTLLAAHSELALNVLHGHLQERERLDQRLAALGRMGAPQRIGNLFMDLRQRLRERGLMHGRVCEWPLSRQQLADAVGLSKVHLMRALRELRTRGLADLRGQHLTVPNEQSLSNYSEYIAASGNRRCTLL